MTTTFSFRIRDGLDSDIDRCLALDHVYETDHVWQMQLSESAGQWQVQFKKDKLPRTMDVTYPADERRLRAALPEEHCFLVAVTVDPAEGESGESEEIVGYLTMRNEAPHRIALVQDLLVSRPYRGHRIGRRLLNVARTWAREHDLVQLMVEIPTKNFPGITFCQQQGFAFCGFNDHYFLNRDIALFFTQSLR